MRSSQQKAQSKMMEIMITTEGPVADDLGLLTYKTWRRQLYMI